MPYETTVFRREGSLGVELPEDQMISKRIKEGDQVHVIETAQGLLILPYDADFDEAMNLYEEGVDTYDDALQDMTDSHP